jgi:hypothetical protein
MLRTLALPDLVPPERETLGVPFQRDTLKLVPASEWHAARTELTALLWSPTLSTAWWCSELPVVRTALQAALTHAIAAEDAWRRLLTLLLPGAEQTIFDVPGARPLFIWLPYTSASLEFESAALLYTLVRLHQQLALVAHAQGAPERVAANLDEAQRRAEYALLRVVPMQATLPPSDAPRPSVPPLLSAHFWQEFVAPLIFATRAECDVRDAKTPEGAAHTLRACALIERSLRAAPATLVRARRDALVECGVARRRALYTLGVALLDHAASTQANLLLRAAESLLEQACEGDGAPDVEHASALRRCRGMLSVLGTSGERYAVDEVELGDGWSYEVASCTLIAPHDDTN